MFRERLFDLLLFLFCYFVEYKRCYDDHTDNYEYTDHTGYHITKVVYKIHRIEINDHYTFSFRLSKEVEYQTAGDYRSDLSRYVNTDSGHQQEVLVVSFKSELVYYTT